MWLRVSEEIYLPVDGIVGFFAPDAVYTGGTAEGDKPRAVALMRDGRAVPMPFGLKSLAGRFSRSGIGHTTAETGE